MDKVIIKDLLVRAIIGINDWERENIQDILINLVLFTDTKMAAVKDAIDLSVNYRTITKSILSLVETANRYTVESLASDIALLCLQDVNVIKVTVTVEKPGAVRFAKSVGVEITRSRE